MTSKMSKIIHSTTTNNSAELHGNWLSGPTNPQIEKVSAPHNRLRDYHEN